MIRATWRSEVELYRGSLDHALGVWSEAAGVAGAFWPATLFHLRRVAHSDNLGEVFSEVSRRVEWRQAQEAAPEQLPRPRAPDIADPSAKPGHVVLRWETSVVLDLERVDSSEYRVVLSEPHATREAAALRYLES